MNPHHRPPRPGSWHCLGIEILRDPFHCLIVSIDARVGGQVGGKVSVNPQGEDRAVAWEVGYRLGQASEFSLLLSYIAVSNALVGDEAALVIQFSTVLTLVVSSYFVIFRYPSPIAPDPKLRRD